MKTLRNIGVGIGAFFMFLFLFGLLSAIVYGAVWLTGTPQWIGNVLVLFMFFPCIGMATEMYEVEKQV